ncbi:MAG: helix-turn-helix domain-containing protein [Leptothrix sp. (in: b-proteobacteria)]
MLKILDQRPDCPAPHVDPADHSPAARAELGRLMREQLAAFAEGLAQGTRRLHRPAPAGVARGEGHFHLAPELFLQVSGWTRFGLPHGEVTVGPGEALLMPARLLHSEAVGVADDGAPFRNLVVYADGRVLTCHLAHEHAAGEPGILYLEARQHPQAGRILAWLGDVAPAALADATNDPATDLQARALVSAALAGVQRALADGAATRDAGEPALIARLRVLIQNQLGDHALSVRRLAEQSGCSADHLSHRFRLAAGEHLVTYLNRQRMERAGHLLADTDLAVKEVAWACGFASASYFIRTFRAHHGATPVAWRVTHQQQVA